VSATARNINVNAQHKIMVITTSPLVKTYTLQEFWDLPEPSDHSKLELIKGVLYMTPPPDHPHNRAAANVDEILRKEIRRCRYRGKVYIPRAAVWIDNDTYLEPDLMYVSAALESSMDPRHWTHADIVVEVISPSNANYDRKTKADTYRAMSGVCEMWLIDNEKKEVDVRSFESDKSATFKLADTLHSAVLPKIRIPIRSLLT
jgi:Uma2 family endonuclease